MRGGERVDFRGEERVRGREEDIWLLEGPRLQFNQGVFCFSAKQTSDNLLHTVAFNYSSHC